jgi:hypothetical protein
MALLFADSFSGYRTADLPTRWVGGVSGSQISNAVLPPNSQAGAQVLFIPNNQQGVTGNNYGAQTRLVLGFRYYKDAGDNSGSIAYAIHQTGVGAFGLPVGLVFDAAGTYFVNDSNTVIATGPVIPKAEWHQYEIDWTFGLSGTATLKLYLDGSPTPFISAVGVSTSYAQAELFSIGGQGPSNHGLNGAQGYFADFYALSGTGPVAMFNAPLAPQGFGGAKMAFGVSNGSGVISNWTPNGAGAIWQCISEIPQDGDTTYASDATPGDQYQCTFAALPAMSSLLAVQLSTYARTDDAGPRAYQSGFWKGGTFGYSGVNQFLGGSYNYIEDEFMLNPVTGLAWTPGDLTGLQFGAKLTV